MLEWPGKHPCGESQANGQGVRISGREGTPRLGVQTWEEGVSTPSEGGEAARREHGGLGEFLSKYYNFEILVQTDRGPPKSNLRGKQG